MVCSEYPFKMPKVGTAMRINCNTTGQMFGFVEVNSRINNGLDLAEVEVHTLGIVANCIQSKIK